LKNLRPILHTSLVVMLGSFALPSHAVLISDNTPYAFGWSYDSQSAAGILSGTGTLTVSGFNSNLLTVGVNLSNTSSPASDRLTAFGFGINGNITGVTFSDASDGGLIHASLASIPSLGSIDVCVFGGPNNCAGGGNGGIYGGQSDSFSLLLSGLWGTSLDIDPIGFKYQTGSGSFEFTTTDRPPTSVPEPATLSLFGFGLLGAAFARRRKRNA
jgi:hypothetical protein